MTPPFGPAEAKFILEAVGFPALRFEHVVTARVIAAIPPGEATYRPCAGARSAEELARHIVVADLRFLEGVVTGAFPDLIPEVSAAPDMASLATTYATRVGIALERLAAPVQATLGSAHTRAKSAATEAQPPPARSAPGASPIVGDDASRGHVRSCLGGRESPREGALSRRVTPHDRGD